MGSPGLQRQGRAAVPAVVLAVLLTACTATVSGSGTVGASSPARSTTAGSARTSTPSNPTAGAVPPPAGCSTSLCTFVGSADLGRGTTVVVHSNPTVDGIGAAYLELREGGVGVDWHEIRDENPGQLRCSRTAHPRNCALVTAVGAHGAHAFPVVVRGHRLRVGEPAVADTPVMRVDDLDGDGMIDALAVQNDYQPSYVDGHTRWETFRRTGHGLTLGSTGCGPVAKGHEPPPAPITLVHGPCSG